MKEFTLSKNSWHYKLANFGMGGGILRVDDETDICSYIRAFLVGTFIFTFVASVFAMLGGWVAFSVYNIIGYFAWGMEIASYVWVLVLIVGGLFSGVASVAGGVALREKLDNTESGFIRLAYQKFKNKTCVKIKLER
jgi:hypothetical protein